MMRFRIVHVGVCIGVAAALLATACNESTWSAASPSASGTSAQQMGPTLLENAMALLNQSAHLDTRDAVYQALDRMNQWIETVEPLDDWQPDPLLDTLPEQYRQLPQVERVGLMQFPRDDGLGLQEVVWLRDTARTAVGDEIEALRRAEKLFDWTVRNLQLDAVPSGTSAEERPPYVPWQTLMLGHATAEERAWVFALLARQQLLDVVILRPAAPADSPDDDGSAEPPLLAALLHKEQLYLFDPQLGLPLPGPEGEGIATLAEAAADDAVLRQLDVDLDGQVERYPCTAEQLSEVQALIEASPLYLTQRGALVEARLLGARQMVLTSDPSGLAQRLEKLPQVKSVDLWILPFDRLQHRDALTPEQRARLEEELTPLRVPNDALWNGRLLHLMGQFTGDPGAVMYYLQSRPTQADLEELSGNENFADQAKSMRVAKQHATYWLGLVAWQRGQYAAAARYFELSLETWPEGIWHQGAQYNLGRSYEALGQREQAAAALRQSTNSPQEIGNLLRAARLDASK